MVNVDGSLLSWEQIKQLAGDFDKPCFKIFTSLNETGDQWARRIISRALQEANFHWNALSGRVLGIYADAKRSEAQAEKIAHGAPMTQAEFFEALEHISEEQLRESLMPLGFTYTELADFSHAELVALIKAIVLLRQKKIYNKGFENGNV